MNYFITLMVKSDNPIDLDLQKNTYIVEEGLKDPIGSIQGVEAITECKDESLKNVIKAFKEHKKSLKNW